MSVDTSNLLRQDIIFSEFDGGYQIPTYLLQCEERQWIISKEVYLIITSLQVGVEIDIIPCFLQNEYGLIVDRQDVQEIIAFLNDNRLISEQLDANKQNSPIHSKGLKNLWGRVTLIPSNFVKKFNFLSFLFYRWIFLFLLCCEWVFVHYTLLNHSASKIVLNIQQLSFFQLVLVYAISGFISVVHEIGHSVALMRYGGNPKRIGVAFYYFMPVFFSDVTDSWRLKRNQRLVVDFGGMYLQLIVTMLISLFNDFILKQSVIQLTVLLSVADIIFNLAPFIKLDGYWMLCDVLGVSNIWSAIFQEFSVKSKKKQKTFPKLKKYQWFILSIYLLLAVFFGLYAGIFIFQLSTKSIHQVYLDILTFVENTSFVLNNFTYYSVFYFFSSRFSSYIIVIFLIRSIIQILKKILCFLSGGKNAD